MLSLMVVAASYPIFLAVVNPVDGTAWRADGTRVESPLPKDILEKMERLRSGWEPTAQRLFVFRYKTPENGWTSGDIPVGKYESWETPFRVDVSEEKGHLLVFSQEMKASATTANFDVQYTVEPPRTLIDVRIVGGKAIVEKGKEFRPRLIASPEEASAVESAEMLKVVKGWWGTKTKSAFEYDYSSLHDWILTTGGFFRTDGSRIFGATGGWHIGQYRVMCDATPPKELGRINLGGMPFRRLEIRGAALNPAVDGDRP